MKNKKVQERDFDFVKFIFIVAVIVIPIRFWVAQPFLVSGAQWSRLTATAIILLLTKFPTG